MKNYYEDSESKALWQRAQLNPVLRDNLFHCPNGGKRNKREAGRLKAMGVRPGVSDYILPVSRGLYHALFIELKPNVKGYSPKVAAAQVEWRTKMIDAGNAAYIIKGWDKAIEIMTMYVNLKAGEWLEIRRDGRGQFDG
jgi:hypothetical protein